MAIFQVNKDRLEPVPSTSFVEEKVMERRDLQQLLKTDISPLGNDLMVIAEEFGNWEDSKRRIDLLCLDKQARLVVVEIKRTEDGGHMELQAIRYAAMVANMTFEQTVSAYARHLGGEDAKERATKEIQGFLKDDSLEEFEWNGDVRILLVANDFSPELTTAVLWLNKHELDITCFRLLPYRLGDKLLVDVTQIIPLPEAADYEVKVRAQERETRKVRNARQEIFKKFWAQTIERSKEKTKIFANRSTTTDHWLSGGIGRGGFNLTLSLTKDRAQAECYIRVGKGNDELNLTLFNALKAQKAEIEQVFGDTLNWDELPESSGCRIHCNFEGGWLTPEAEWPDLQDRMINAIVNLENALRKPIQQLKM